MGIRWEWVLTGDREGDVYAGTHVTHSPLLHIGDHQVRGVRGCKGWEASTKQLENFD